MSKGAVEKYGVNTLSAMNAAGGGTNIPTITNEYNNGGIVDRSRYYNMMGSPMVRAKNTQKVNFNTGGFVGDSIKVTGDKVSSKNIFSPLQNFYNGGVVLNTPQSTGSGSRKIDGQALVSTMKTDAAPIVNTTMQVADTKPTTQVVPPPSTNNNVVQNYNIQKEQQKKQYSGGGGTKVPQINAEKYVSKQKIRTLGIMG